MVNGVMIKMTIDTKHYCIFWYIFMFVIPLIIYLLFLIIESNFSVLYYFGSILFLVVFFWIIYYAFYKLKKNEGK